MTKLWEFLLDSRGGERRNQTITFQDWANLWGADGPMGGFMPTSMSTTSDEELVGSVYEAYCSNGPVFALVYARMQIFSQARFQWTRWNGGTPGDLFGSPDLAILERPWNGGTTADLLGRMEVFASGAGNAFTRRVKRGTKGSRDRADFLHMLQPQWTTIVMGSQEDAEHPSDAGDTELLGYIYRPHNDAKRQVVLLPHEVSHYAPIPDPYNNFVGMSWITPVLGDVRADDASQIHKRKFFQNAATPNLAIKFDPTVGVDSVKAFKELVEDDHKGMWNAYKTLYLGGGADPVVVGKDFRQLDFAATQGKGETRLAAAAGMPPSWVGFSEGLKGSSLNAGNFAAGRRRMIDGTAHHLWTNAAASLEVLLDKPPSRGDESPASLWIATGSIPLLREDAKEHAETQFQQAQTIRQLIDGGFEPDSAVQAVKQSDYSLLKHTGLVSVQLQKPGTKAGQPTTGQNGDGS